MLHGLIKIKVLLCLYVNKHNTAEDWLYLDNLAINTQKFEDYHQKYDSKTGISSVILLIHILKYTLQMKKVKTKTHEKFKNVLKSYWLN